MPDIKSSLVSPWGLICLYLTFMYIMYWINQREWVLNSFHQLATFMQTRRSIQLKWCGVLERFSICQALQFYFSIQCWFYLLSYSYKSISTIFLLIRLRQCIATINRWTDYCNNREIIVVIILDVSKTSQNNRSRWFKKIITPMVMLTP